MTFQFPIKSFYETHANDDVKLLVDRQLFERPLLINADITLHNRVLANAFVKGQENNVSIYGNYAKLIVQSIVILDTSDSVQESVMSDFVNSLFAQGNLEATIDIERERVIKMSSTISAQFRMSKVSGSMQITLSDCKSVHIHERGTFFDGVEFTFPAD